MTNEVMAIRIISPTSAELTFADGSKKTINAPGVHLPSMGKWIYIDFSLKQLQKNTERK